MVCAGMGGLRRRGEGGKGGKLVSSSRPCLIADDHTPEIRLTTDCTVPCILQILA